MQQLLNARVKYNEDLSEDQLDKDELLADRVGMYAMVRTGYAPRAFSENLDRISANKGHTGSFLTDVFDINSLVSRRVRTARSLTNELPSECKDRAPGASPEFKEFQEKIRSAPINWLIDPTPSLKSFRMDPLMRPALDQVRFSPNAQFVLAQDETSIHVLSRSPLKLLFSINAPGAKDAHFTPDSTQVVFHYPTMRVERWNVTSGKRDGYFELVDYKGCPQTSLAPDGKTFVCLSVTRGGVWLKLMDVDTGKLFYDNKNFYEPDYDAQPWSTIVRYVSSPEVGTLAYSQDGRTLIVATGSKVMATTWWHTNKSVWAETFPVWYRGKSHLWTRISWFSIAISGPKVTTIAQLSKCARRRSQRDFRSMTSRLVTSGWTQLRTAITF
jgi:hypothetical protein